MYVESTTGPIGSEPSRSGYIEPARIETKTPNLPDVDSPTPPPTLRPYQIVAREEISAKFQEGLRRIILCLPTGAGKTVTFAYLVYLALQRGKRVLVLTDRIELLTQGDGTFTRFGMKASIISAGSKRLIRHNLYIAMVETLDRRIKRGGSAFFDSMGPVDLIIVDEAHKAAFWKVLEAFPNAFVVGATATPLSASKKKPLNTFYDDIVEPVSIRELIDSGWLSRMRLYAGAEHLTSLKVRGGEYTEESLMQFFGDAKMYANAVRHYRDHADGEKALCFCVNVQHSIDTAQHFRDAGIEAAHIDGTTSEFERKLILANFAKGYIKVLCNVGVLTTGYDEASIQCIIINRKTKSLPLWLQMCGRGSRVTDGVKDSFKIIDLGSNYIEHFPWDFTHNWTDIFHTAQVKSAEPGEAGEAITKVCKQCEAVNHASALICKECGAEFPVKEKELIEDAELVELTGREAWWNDLARLASGRPYSNLSVEEIYAVRKDRNFKLGWAVHLLRAKNDDQVFYQYAQVAGYKMSWATRMIEFNQNKAA